MRRFRNPYLEWIKLDDLFVSVQCTENSVVCEVHGKDLISICGKRVGLTAGSVDRSQAPNGRLCRVAVTDLGEFAPAVTIRGRGLLGCVVALHIIMRSATSNVSQ